jgi:Na+/H+ antiporter NhaD/arsenite permease-like protein
MMNDQNVALAVFIICYAFFIRYPRRRPVTACAGAFALILSGALGWHEALVESISWNIMGLMVGTLILAELFKLSRMPAVLAEVMVGKARSVRGAMLSLCMLAGLVSAFVENVAVVVLIAPVAWSLAEKLNVSPVGPLIFIAVCANLQGSATLIGDPPSMIMASHMKMGFTDFFVYDGRPGLFFAVQIGAIASSLVIARFFRDLKQPVAFAPIETLRSATPTMLVAALILGLSMVSVWDPELRWLAGTYTLVLAVVGLLWYRAAGWGSARRLVAGLDWDTVIFIAGVFVIVGALSESGLLDQGAHWIAGQLGANVPLAFVAVVVFAVVVSAFVDNVPFLIAMLPVVRTIAGDLHAPEPLFVFGLLIGTCVGGNITPIGASANIVIVGMLAKKGHVVNFREFMSLGLPFTIAALSAACLFIWWTWAP